MSDPSPLEIALGSEVRAWRQRRQMTLQDLATKSGTSKATVERLENASHSTSVLNTWKIAQALGVQLSDLIRRAEEVVILDAQRSAQVPWTDDEVRALLRGMPEEQAARSMGWTVRRLQTFLSGDDLSKRRTRKPPLHSFDEHAAAARDEDRERPQLGDE